jgi:hypothetical protein
VIAGRLDGKNNKDIAKGMGRSEARVSQLLSTAVAKLRDGLRRHGAEFQDSNVYERFQHLRRVHVAPHVPASAEKQALLVPSEQLRQLGGRALIVL